MTPIKIVFHKVDDSPLWPESKPPVIDAGTLAKVAILDQGMESGLPSVMFAIELPDGGGTVIAQQTARNIVSLGRMILARYPRLLG